MSFEIFGREISFGKIGKKTPKANDIEKVPESFSAPKDTGADTEIVVHAGHTGAAAYATYLDFDMQASSDLVLINQYRRIAQQQECESAIDDIVNDAIVIEVNKAPVSVNLDKSDLSETLKKKIGIEFEYILNLLDFDTYGTDIFRQWYIDGRIYYHQIVDETNMEKGLIELRPIDSRKIKKIREIIKQPKDVSGVEVVTGINEYYIYKDLNLTKKNVETLEETLKIPTEYIAYNNSGKRDVLSNKVIGYLHKAIKPMNQLRMIEDAVVIYRITRAPERRVFYIDVGNLPKIKAEQYIEDIMNRYRNKMVYDASTGEIKTDHKHMAMLEDFWLPRREGGKGTEISTLPGGSNLSEMDDVQYFQKKLYRSLSVPVSRLEAESGFNLGRSSEITRDEMKFSKFINTLQIKFSILFKELLKTQLVIKNIFTEDDWEKYKNDFHFVYLKNSYFEELKNTEILNNRMEALSNIDEYVKEGRYYSEDWVKKHVLMQSEEEINQINTDIKKQEPIEDTEGDNKDE